MFVILSICRYKVGCNCDSTLVSIFTFVLIITKKHNRGERVLLNLGVSMQAKFFSFSVIFIGLAAFTQKANAMLMCRYLPCTLIKICTLHSLQ